MVTPAPTPPTAPPDDDWLTDQLPFPLAFPWHQATRRVMPVERLQAMLSAGEATLRALTCFLLADYLSGPTETAAHEALRKLRKPTVGDWSKAVDALTEALLARASSPSFFAPLASWRASEASRIARELVSLRNAVQHGRRGVDRAASHEAGQTAEHLLREFLRTLTWLADYELVQIQNPATTREQLFAGHWLVHKGRHRDPRPIPTRWSGWLASDSLYLVHRGFGAALDLAPFLATSHEPHASEDVVVVLESVSDKQVVLRQLFGKLSLTLPLQRPTEPELARRFWLDPEPTRRTAVRVLAPTAP